MKCGANLPTSLPTHPKENVQRRMSAAGMQGLCSNVHYIYTQSPSAFLLQLIIALDHRKDSMKLLPWASMELPWAPMGTGMQWTAGPKPRQKCGRCAVRLRVDRRRPDHAGLSITQAS